MHLARLQLGCLQGLGAILEAGCASSTHDLLGEVEGHGLLGRQGERGGEGAEAGPGEEGTQQLRALLLCCVYTGHACWLCGRQCYMESREAQAGYSHPLHLMFEAFPLLLAGVVGLGVDDFPRR